MGDTVHQVLVQSAAKAVLAGSILGGLCAALGVVNRHLAVHDLLDELLRLVDAIVHPGEQHRFAVEAGGLHLLFCCHDDAVAVCDLFSGEDVLCSIRAIGLHLGGQPQLVTGLGQGFRCHIGVGDAVDAGGHGQNAVTALGDLLLGEALRAELSLLLCIDAVKELCRGLCGLQLFYKVLVHQHLHHTGQHVHMQAAVFRSRNGKQQVGGTVVLGIVLHRAAQPQRRQTGPGNYIGLGVGHRDAVVHIGGALRLTGIKGLFVGILVRDVAMGGLQLHQTADYLLLIGQSLIQCDGLRGE